MMETHVIEHQVKAIHVSVAKLVICPIDLHTRQIGVDMCTDFQQIGTVDTE